MKRRRCAAGTFRSRTSWNLGVMPARWTEPFPWCSRSLSRCIPPNPSMNNCRRFRKWCRLQSTTLCALHGKSDMPEPILKSGGGSALHDGVRKHREAPEAAEAPALPVSHDDNVPTSPSTSLELVIRPDPYLLDGRHANNAWLQELPKPVSKITWGNAAFLSPRTAAAQHLHHGAMVELKRAGRSVVLPAFVLPGHAEDCVTIHLGHGRAKTGRVGSGVGFNAAIMQTRVGAVGRSGLELWSVPDGSHVFATTHDHHRMEGRDLVRVESALPGATAEMKGAQALLFGRLSRRKRRPRRKNPFIQR